MFGMLFFRLLHLLIRLKKFLMNRLPPQHTRAKKNNKQDIKPFQLNILELMPEA